MSTERTVWHSADGKTEYIQVPCPCCTLKTTSGRGTIVSFCNNVEFNLAESYRYQLSATGSEYYTINLGPFAPLTWMYKVDSITEEGDGCQDINVIFTKCDDVGTYNLEGENGEEIQNPPPLNCDWCFYDANEDAPDQYMQFHTCGVAVGIACANYTRWCPEGGCKKYYGPTLTITFQGGRANFDGIFESSPDCTATLTVRKVIVVLEMTSECRGPLSSPEDTSCPSDQDGCVQIWASIHYASYWEVLSCSQTHGATCDANLYQPCENFYQASCVGNILTALPLNANIALCATTGTQDTGGSCGSTEIFKLASKSETPTDPDPCLYELTKNVPVSVPGFSAPIGTPICCEYADGGMLTPL